jgi:branched-chain amino acid transport system substrate-binding protein
MQSDSWRVGVLFSETGVTGAVELTQRYATLLAIDEINASGGVLGKPIEPILHDPRSTPSLYRELALKLCDVDRVNVIFGCHMSNGRKAALPVVEARGALLFYPHLYEGFEYSPSCIYTGATPSQQSILVVDYLIAHGWNRVFLVGSDYVYPYESNRIIADLFLKAGGKVLGDMYVPLEMDRNHADQIVDRIRQTQPDVIYSTVVGQGIIPFFRAFKEAGFDAWTMPIVSQSTSEADFEQMTAEVAAGHITAAPFFSTLDRLLARDFVQRYRKAYSGLPTAAAEAAYFQTHLYALALTQAGSDRLADLLPALSQVEYDAPQGLVQIDAETNHTHLWPRIARINTRGEYDIVCDPGVRVAPDPFMLKSRLDMVRVRAGSLAI